MRQTIIIASLVGSLIIIGSSFRLFESLFFFLIVGAIPGTNYSLSPTLMSAILSSLMALIIAHFAIQYVNEKRATTPNQQLPKRRIVSNN